MNVPKLIESATSLPMIVDYYEEMRHDLLCAIGELRDIAERHAWTKDPEEKRRTEGALAHARELTQPHNYNGRGPFVRAD